MNSKIYLLLILTLVRLLGLLFVDPPDRGGAQYRLLFAQLLIKLTLYNSPAPAEEIKIDSHRLMSARRSRQQLNLFELKTQRR